MKATTENKKLRQYAELLVKNNSKYPEWRWGQNFFNTLLEFDPELAEEIRGTDIDPFYMEDIDKMKPFFEKVREAWKDD